MNKLISKITFGIILLLLGFNLVSKSLESKYNTTNLFTDIPAISTGISVNRKENDINIVLFNKTFRVPNVIEFSNPLLRK